MKTSIATVSISGDLVEKLEAIADAGFDGVEIFENDFLIYDRSAKDVAKIVRDLGMEITLFQPFRDFEGMPKPQRSRNFDRAEKKFDVMQELGTDLVLVCSNVSKAALGGIERAVDDFRELGERAAKRGLRIGYEALAWGTHIHDHRDAWEIVRRTDMANVGLILDSFHTLSRRIDVNSIRSIPADKLFFVQLADAPMINMDILQWSRHFRNMPGEGDLPVFDFLKAVADTGYDGYLSLEIFNDQFRGGRTRLLARDGHRSLIYLGDQVRRADENIKMQVPAMPQPIEAQSIAFIEFATSPEEGEKLEIFLSKFGFQRRGKHKTKNVIRMQQGDINLLINNEKSGFAHSSYLLHGTNAYAFAVMVDDADAALARALALDPSALKDNQELGPQSLPAVRNIGGGLVYFLDQSDQYKNIWENDFDPIEPQESIFDAGLLTVDHIGQTMPVNEMPGALLFYSSIFNTKKTPVFDIIDPYGIVRSQVVENDRGTFRITMNGAENRQTFAGSFLAENFGSSLQHVAFSTNDIFATSAMLEENGFVPLQISPNYYDDIEARFGLDDDFVEKLRQYNLLYDRDDEGEYFQIYGPVFGAGFFFEIVQRRTYNGYGAANAIFRLAAQKRYMRPKGMPHLPE